MDNEPREYLPGWFQTLSYNGNGIKVLDLRRKNGHDLAARITLTLDENQQTTTVEAVVSVRGDNICHEEASFQGPCSEQPALVYRVEKISQYEAEYFN